MRNDSEQPQSMRETVNTGMNIFLFFAQLICRPAHSLTTRAGSAGKRYFGSLTFGLGLMMFPFWMAFIIPSLQLPPGKEGFGGVLLFWLTMILAGMVQRAWGVVKRKNGYHTHSHYWGTALLPGIFTATESGKHKVRSDCLLCLCWGYGFGLLTGSVPLMLYGWLALAGTIVQAAFTEMQDNARLDATEDAEAESEWMANELRKRRASRRN